MSLQRAQRVREEIKKEASEIIRQMKDPRIGFVTVTDVEVTNDLRQVRIYVSVYGDDEAKERTMEGLQAATGHVRTEVGKRIRLRHTPEISFRLDASIERGARINALLDEVAGVKKSAEESQSPSQETTE